MNTDSLRTGTRAEHEAVETLLPLMDPGLTRAQYANVLRGMYRAVRPWEDWAEVHAPPRLAAMVAERRRAHLIETDLRFLRQDVPAAEVMFTLQAVFGEQPVNPVAFEAAFLGAMYVVEGSTLGGQYIARHVEDLFGFEPGVGDAFFRGYGEQTGENWRSFKQFLVAVPDEETPRVIAAAKAMFAFFGSALRPLTAAASTT